MKIETRKISSLRPDAANARKHSSKNLTAIAGSLTIFGQQKPIVVSAAGIILAGNGTVEAALSLGWSEIAVVTAPADWDANMAKAFALADNRTAELAEWDANVLASQLVDLNTDGWDVTELGFNLPDEEKEPEELDSDEVDFDSKFEVVIECKNELQQEELLFRFTEEGFKVKAIIL